MAKAECTNHAAAYCPEISIPVLSVMEINIFNTGTSAPCRGTTNKPIITEKKNSRPRNDKNVKPNAAYAAKSSGRIVAGIVTAIDEMKLVANLFSVSTVVYELMSQFWENGLRKTSHQPEV